MPSITVSHLSFTYASTPLLEDVSFHVGDSERAVIVGPNGCGKTTLLQILAGTIEPHRGSIEIDPAGSLAQQILDVPSSGTAQGYLDRVLHPITSLVERFEEVSEQLSDSSPTLEREYNDLLAAMTAADVWNLETRVQETLAGLGLGKLDLTDRDLSTLSPGQRARLHLAALLMTRPPVLLLDEPTNHLDRGAIDYLVRVIADWDGPVIMASHDRAFIDDTATVIYDLDLASWQALATASGGGSLPGVYRCQGNYSDYLEAKRVARTSHEEIHSAQQSRKREITAHRHAAGDIARGGVRLATAQGSAKKFFADRATATAKRRTSSDDRRLEALADREVRKPRSYDLQLTLHDPPVQPGVAISARDAQVSGRLAPITFDLSYGEHLLITGHNGSGKSTLLNWIASGMQPEDAEWSGHIDREKALHAIPQRLPERGDGGFSGEIWDNGIGDLGSGILHPSMWATPIHELSAGNQRRAQLAIAASLTPSILIIDEPTNYLDLATIEALEDALRSWPGTLVIASHDRWLIEHWHGRRVDLATSR